MTDVTGPKHIFAMQLRARMITVIVFPLFLTCLYITLSSTYEATPITTLNIHLTTDMTEPTIWLLPSLLLLPLRRRAPHT